MPRECESCGKKTTTGNQITRRGRAKYLGGVGIKTTGVTGRKFIPNLQNVRVQLPNGTIKRIKLCTQCMRSTTLVKPLKRPKIAPKVKAPKAPNVGKAKRKVAQA
jgi:large subunit ribosomal protein L28